MLEVSNIGMRRSSTLALVVLQCLLCTTAQSTEDAEQHNKHPNVVILFADNLGYEDVSIFSSAKHDANSRTPNIDRLGEGGLRFLHWNSAASLCSASRAALLTGKYPVRTGIYPHVFEPDAEYGLLPEEITLPEYLKQHPSANYETSIVGKWHLGQRPEYLPTNQGFDHWVGIPYHNSGGSVDEHVCSKDTEANMWLPLFENETIAEQPVKLEHLASRYASEAAKFMERSVERNNPFFLYLAFSHVHQLCAPNDFPEQATCQWSGLKMPATSSSFSDAVEEMDWIAGQVMDTLDRLGVENQTLVIFTSDNGPWVAEQSCAGSKGPFQGTWLKENVDANCTACPHDYVPSPTKDRPRRCTLPTNALMEVDGVHCGEDTGLGSVWEANLRMPAIAKFPGHISPGRTTLQSVSTLDILPTILSITDLPVPTNLDGKDISVTMFNNDIGEEQSQNVADDPRVLFFWRDGFQDGPLPEPFGRFDVAAVKVGTIKAHIWTKSAHYNDDVEQHHDPPILFDIIADPAEAKPLNPKEHLALIDKIVDLVQQHLASIDWMQPLALARDPKYLPCFDRSTKCRTHPAATNNISKEK